VNSLQVSVVMPVYNGARYLREAVDSILSQTYTDFEFIIVDDGSTDETPAILATYAKADPRVVLVPNHQNLGLVHSLNRGLALARGEYVARMDADDISLAERFERQVAYLEVHPDVGVLGTNIIYIDSEGQPLGDGKPKDRWPVTPQVARWMLLWRCPIYHPTVMIRRAALAQMASAYDPAYQHAEDRELWTRLSRQTCIASLPDVLVQYRITASSVSRRHQEEQRAMDHAIMRRELTALLGQTPPDALETLIGVFSKHQTNTKADYVGAADLLFEAYRRFCQAPLPSADRRQIEADVAFRLVSIAYATSGTSSRLAFSILTRLRHLSPERWLRSVPCKRIVLVLLRSVGIEPRKTDATAAEV